MKRKGDGNLPGAGSILKNIPLIIQPGFYWHGWFSESLISGVILSVIAVSVALLLARIE